MFYFKIYLLFPAGNFVTAPQSVCMTLYCEISFNFYYNILSNPVLSGDTVILPSPRNLLPLCSAYVITLLLTQAKSAFLLGGYIYISVYLHIYLSMRLSHLTSVLSLLHDRDSQSFRRNYLTCLEKQQTYECTLCCIFAFTTS